MHKNLKFSEHLISPILSGTKTSTWRLWDDKNLSIGDIVDFLEYGTKKHFATARIFKMVEKPLGILTKEDKDGHESFNSDQDMYSTFEKYYNKKVDHETLVKIVWFELI